MTGTPELASEAFQRWAKVVWPYLLGVFGCAIIFVDTLLQPPGDPTTSGIGLGLISATGAIGLDRFRKGSNGGSNRD